MTSFMLVQLEILGKSNAYAITHMYILHLVTLLDIKMVNGSKLRQTF